MELKGRVDDSFESIIQIELLTNKGTENVEFVIDTGFNGDLVLPKQLISAFNFVYLFSTQIDLVGKSFKQVDFFRGQIRWLNDEIVPVEVIEDEAFLIGTNLLRHGKLWIDYQSNEVLITK